MDNNIIDHSVVERASLGDYRAFGKLFHAFYPKMHRFAVMLLKNNDDADDACQLIFMKLWLRKERLAGVSDIDGYLFMLGKHTILDYISTRKLQTVPLDNIPDSADDLTPQEQMIADDTKVLIDLVVDNMPPQRQAIYRLSREQHKKNEEIAQELGLTKKTVENHLNLALKDIKKALRLAMIAFALWV